MDSPYRNMDICVLFSHKLAVVAAHAAEPGIGNPKLQSEQAGKSRLSFSSKPALRPGIFALLHGDPARGYRSLLPFAKSGDPEAQYWLGCILTKTWFDRMEGHAFGGGSTPMGETDPPKTSVYTDVDERTGLRYLVQASRQGHGVAEIYIEYLLYLGLTAYPTSEMTLRPIRASSNLGIAASFRHMANFHGMRGDHPREYKWLYLFYNCSDAARPEDKDLWDTVRQTLSNRTEFSPAVMRRGERLIQQWKDEHEGVQCFG